MMFAHQFFNVRTAARAVLAEYTWADARPDVPPQTLTRVGCRWARFPLDGFITNPFSIEHLKSLVANGTILEVPAALSWKVTSLHATKVNTVGHCSVIVASEIEGGGYMVQDVRLLDLDEDGILTIESPSQWAYESWRGAKAQVTRMLEAKRSLEWHDYPAGDDWPERLFAAVEEERKALAAKPPQDLSKDEFAARMRALRAKGGSTHGT